MSDADREPMPLGFNDMRVVPVALKATKGVYLVEVRKGGAGVGSCLKRRTARTLSDAWQATHTAAPARRLPQRHKVLCNGDELAPTAFEALGGRANSRKWRFSIRCARRSGAGAWAAASAGASAWPTQPHGSARALQSAAP